MKTHTTTRSLLVAAALTLALAGCSDSGSDTGSSSGSDAGAQPSSTQSQAGSPRPPLTGTASDCVGAIEKRYKSGAFKDASADPACKDLSGEQYTHFVGLVLLAHKDPELQNNDGTNAWDAAWDNMGSDTRGDLCEMLKREGPDGAAPVISKAQGQHLLDAKC
jgi:hypothetical protein